MGRPYRYAVDSMPRADGQLSIVRVEAAWRGPDTIVLSDGQEVFSRWERLTTQCLWHCQERTAISPRLWMTPDGVELITLRPLPELTAGTPPESF